MAARTTTTTLLRVAVLVIPPIQLLDVSPVDLFHMLSKQYLSECKLPQPFIDQGLEEVRIYYVSAGGPSTPSSSSTPLSIAPSFAEMTASASLKITHGLTATDVQPGAIDVLLVPGPDPSLVPAGEVLAFIRAHASVSTTTVMSVCTGVIPLAKAGVLNDRVCTGPRALLGMLLKKDYPEVKWVERRWAVDVSGPGELWTAGGITNGLDMVAAYIRQNYSRELADLVCAMADVGDRGVEYGNSSAAEGMWWGWLLLRSWVTGLLGKKTKRERVCSEEVVGKGFEI